MARIPGIDQLNKVDGKLRDIANRLDRVSSVYEHMGKAIERYASKNDDLANQMDKVDDAHQKGIISTQEYARQLRDIQVQIDSSTRKWSALGQVVGGKVLGAFDKLGKSLFMLGLDAMKLGVNKLEHAIIQIYNVHEKWAKLMGEFRNRLGVATKGVRELGKTAASVEGMIYGLTGAFGSGAPMVAEFVEGLERVVNVVKGDSMGKLVKEGIMLGRAMGMSAGEVGKMGFMLQQLGEGSKEQRELFKDIQAGASAAGVSTAAFGKEIVASRGFMTSFGKEGRKMFVQMTTYARSFGVSLKSLEAFTKVTDTFDSTATSVAKLNTVFGTTISSLELMLEQDPSKRLETVRQALLSQGKSFEDLSRQERGFLAETMNLTQEELAGIMQTGKTLEEVQVDQEKARKQSEKDQKNIQRLVSKTATTLFSFAQAWDRVWMAVQRLIKPFTDLIGLTNSGEKGAKSFSAVMKGLFDRFIKFIDEVAANPEWQGFMKSLAGDTKDFLKWISKVVTGSNLKEWIHIVVEGAGNFYNLMKSAFTKMVDTGKTLMPILKFVMEHIDKIIIGWGIMKGVTAAGGMVKGAMGLAKGLSIGKSAGGAGGGMGGKILGGLGKAAMAAGPWGMAIAGVAALGVAAWKYGSKIERSIPTKLDGAVLEDRLNGLREKTSLTESAKLAMDELIIDQRKRERQLIREGNDGRAAALKYDKERAKQDEAAAAARKQLGVTGLEDSAKGFDKTKDMGDARRKYMMADAKMSAGDSKEIAALLSGGTQDELTKAAILAGQEYEAKKKSLGADSAQAKAAKELETKLTRLSGATSRANEIELKSQQIKLKIMESDVLLSQLRQTQNSGLAEAIAGLKPGQDVADLFAQGKFHNDPLANALYNNTKQTNDLLRDIGGPTPFASGGVVTRPTRAVIGEAGPEAVIPLRAIARGGRRSPMGVGNSTAAGAMANLAGGRGGNQSSTVAVAAGDVYLDGRLVGRHIARAMLEQEGS